MIMLYEHPETGLRIGVNIEEETMDARKIGEPPGLSKNQVVVAKRLVTETGQDAAPAEGNDLTTIFVFTDNGRKVMFHRVD